MSLTAAKEKAFKDRYNNIFDNIAVDGVEYKYYRSEIDTWIHWKKRIQNSQEPIKLYDYVNIGHIDHYKCDNCGNIKYFFNDVNKRTKEHKNDTIDPPDKCSCGGKYAKYTHESLHSFLQKAKFYSADIMATHVFKNDPKSWDGLSYKDLEEKTAESLPELQKLVDNSKEHVCLDTLKTIVENGFGKGFILKIITLESSYEASSFENDLKFCFLMYYKEEHIEKLYNEFGLTGATSVVEKSYQVMSKCYEILGIRNNDRNWKSQIAINMTLNDLIPDKGFSFNASELLNKTNSDLSVINDVKGKLIFAGSAVGEDNYKSITQVFIDTLKLIFQYHKDIFQENLGELLFSDKNDPRFNDSSNPRDIVVDGETYYFDMRSNSAQKFRDLRDFIKGYIDSNRIDRTELEEYVFSFSEDKKKANAQTSSKKQRNNETIKIICETLEKKRNLILYGPPGTGKTTAAKICAELLAEKNYKIVQFHPAYNYNDFVETINVVNGIGYKPQIFKNFANEANNAVKKAKDSSKIPKFVLIIDEINRANVADVFGELLYGLENRNSEVTTSVSASALSVPDNLYIIGTMNTADRSLQNLDYAVRRRFAFIKFESRMPEPDKKKDRDLNYYKVKGSDSYFLKDLFSIVKRDVECSCARGVIAEDIMPGTSYFLVNNESNGISKEHAKYKINYELIPLLKEYAKDGLFTKMNTLDEENNTLVEMIINSNYQQKLLEIIDSY